MNFNDIRGQSLALEKIQTDIREENLSGAYLFSGPQGVGKKMAAISLAKALNCKQNSINGCERCSSCIKIEKMIHPNLRIVNPEGNYIKIEQIRRLKADSSLKIYEGRKKVWIIDEAEKLTQEAANSLLKILEEPPLHLVIILITHIPRLLPPTIISRCRIIHFSPLRDEDINEILKKQKNIKAEFIPIVSQLARGSMSEALKLIEEESILKEREKAFNLLQRGKALAKEAFTLSERWSTQKNSDIETLLNIVLFFLRDILLLKMGNDVSIINKDKEGKLLKMKEDFSLSHLCKAIETVEKSKFLLHANLSAQLILETMWMRIFYPEYNLING